MATPKHVEIYRQEKWYCAKCGNLLMDTLEKGDRRRLWCVTAGCERFHWQLLRPDLFSVEVIEISP